MHAESDRLTIHSSFGAWLRSERERRKITIASIAESTKILGALFEGLENDDLSRWPDGLYRRAFVRAYAQAIGLDSQMVVNEFVTRFADAPAASATSSLDVGEETELRITLAETRFQPRLILQTIARRLGAIGLDLGVIALSSAALWMIVDPVFALGMVACGYPAASVLILGNTLGMWTFAEPPKNRARRSSVFRRAHDGVLGLFNERPAPAATPVDHPMASFEPSA